MARIGNNTISFIFLAVAALLIASPCAAWTAAVYGDTAGFNPDLHTDTCTVVYSLAGDQGAALDANITGYTDPSVDVIFMGGDDTFTDATASRLEGAVRSGRILVVTYKNYHHFDDSLPAATNGTVRDAKYLEVSGKDTRLSHIVFNGLRSTFPNTNQLASRPQSSAKSGAITLLEYENKGPALLYWKYGNGYVVEWTTLANQRFLNSTEADLINARLIAFLLNAGQVTPSQTTTPTTAPTARTDAGDLSVYSSPLGASILIDGRYYGTTPANLTGIAAGNHIIRLSLSGYYDYEGTVYVPAGQASHAYGTLQPLGQYTGSPTPVQTSAAPIIIEVPATPQPTATSGSALDNPGVLVALIGVLTASIGAAATIFSHIFKSKKE